MTEYYRLRFRKDSKTVYAAHGSQFEGRPTTLWYTVKTAALAYKFRKIVIIHRLLRGPKLFRDLMVSGATWEIVHCSEKVVEAGVNNIRILSRKAPAAPENIA